MKTALFLTLPFLALTLVEGTAVSLYGNLAFYGRGSRRLPRYWKDLNKVKCTNGAMAYFPYTDADSEQEVTTTTAPAEGETNDDVISNDKAINYPINIYLPSVINKKEGEPDYSEIRFEVERNDEENVDSIVIDFSEYKTFKAEMKFRPPPVSKLVDDGYTCENIGLPCTNLADYDFTANPDEWLSLVDYRIFFEDPVNMNSEYFDEEDKVDFIYEFDSFPKPTSEWTEVIGTIGNMDYDSKFTSFIMRNYGTMPVYLSVGNSMFLKERDTVMVQSGKFQNGFGDWSWGNKTRDYPYANDPNNENALYYFTDKDGGFACYVSVDTYNVGFAAPPEGISFRVHPIEDNNFQFRVSHSDNSYWLKNLTTWLVDRNCQIPVGKQSTVLVDIRSMMYLDSKRMLKNEVSGFWVQSISEIKVIKDLLLAQGLETESINYLDEMYFYDYTLHHTFPTDLSKFKINTFNKTEGMPECDITVHSHKDWSDKSNQWPNDVTFDEVFKSKNIISAEVYNNGLNSGDGPSTTTTTTTEASAAPTEAPTDTASATGTVTSTSTPTQGNSDNTDDAISNKVFSMTLLFTILSLFVLFY